MVEVRGTLTELCEAGHVVCFSRDPGPGGDLWHCRIYVGHGPQTGTYLAGRADSAAVALDNAATAMEEALDG